MKNRKIYVLSSVLLLLISCATGAEKSEKIEPKKVDNVVIKFDSEREIQTASPALKSPDNLPIIDNTPITPDSVKIKSDETYESIKEEAEKIRKSENYAKRNVNKDEILSSQFESNTKSISGKKDFYNAIVEYDFIDGKIYDIITSLYSVTDIRLEKGERISGDIAIGDSALCDIETTESEEGGERIVHLLVKAREESGYTTMMIPTTRRTYYFRLTATNKSAMIGCRFTYSKKNGNYKYTSHSDEKDGLLINAEKIDFDYSISIDYDWAPSAVFSDGRRTVIQFPPSFINSSITPALYIKRGNDIGLINYIIKGNLYIADTVISDNESLLLITNGQSIEINRSYE